MPATPRRDRWWLWLLAGLALLGAPAVLIAVMADDSHDPSEHRTTSTAPGPTASADQAVDVGMEHIHGLGVDPADGTLYAATHFGVFAVANGSATRVGNMQDTMGFTVVGPNTFLGSGHPDFDEDDEPLMGLIESTDAGRTWQHLSLRGAADFHALQVVGETVFGYDSTTGTYMSTTDRRTWERRSRVPLYDFAVSRNNVDEVVGTREQGVLRSIDGGRSWAAVPGAPALVVVDASPDGLVGVDATGVLHVSTDGGLTWAARGGIGGAPAAVSIGPEQGAPVYVADRDGRIVVSRNGGTTFELVYAP